MSAAVAQRARVWPSWSLTGDAGTGWVSLQRALTSASQDPPCAAEPELWFASVQSSLLALAVEGCSQCPVLQLCRAYAVAAGEAEGVWGGTTPADRRGA